MHIPGKKNVADYLSRVPGSEALNAAVLCSLACTLGLEHSDSLDNNSNLCGALHANLSSVVSIFEESSFLERLKQL